MEKLNEKKLNEFNAKLVKSFIEFNAAMDDDDEFKVLDLKEQIECDENSSEEELNDGYIKIMNEIDMGQSFAVFLHKCLFDVYDGVTPSAEKLRYKLN